MKARAKRVLWVLGGWAALVLGFIGIVVPFLHGLLFVFIGLAILSGEYTWAQKVLDKVRARFPRVAAFSDGAYEKVNSFRRGERRSTVAAEPAPEPQGD